MLDVRDLDVRYGPITALQGCTLKAETGSITAILGANGAGKSSLMKAISGIVRPGAGSIVVDGEDLTRLPAHERARRGISHALEGRRLFHRMTVAENLHVAWDFRKPGGGDFRAAAERAYQRFPVLAERRHTPAGLLSGGQQQMLILSAALIHQPRLLLLDEPSLGLAPVVVQQIFDVIKAVRQEHRTTVILSEQVAALALASSDQAYVLRRGRVVHHGPSAALARDPSLSAAYLGG
jgi:branched-chain amino acid transport system ATP-binding protein